MNPEQLRERTLAFAVAIDARTRTLAASAASTHAVSQVVRAAAAVGANYRAAGRARSHAEFTAKIGLVVEEADECLYWLDYLRRIGSLADEDGGALTREATELVSIFAKSYRTAKARHARGSPGGHNPSHRSGPAWAREDKLEDT